MATITKRTWKTAKGESREAWRLSYTDIKGKRNKEQFGTKKEAEARLKTVNAQEVSGTLITDAKAKTIADAVSLYSDHLDKLLRDDKKSRMYVENTKRQLDMWIMGNTPIGKPKIDGLGGMKLMHATTLVFQQHAEMLESKGLSVVLVRRVMGAMVRCMAHAQRNALIAQNVAKGTRIESVRGKDGSEKVVPPTKDEFAAILKAAEAFPPAWAKQPHGAVIRFTFAARTGLRASEMWALQWKHIDFAKRSVSVVQSVDAFGNFSVTKTKAGTRSVPMGKGLIDDLKAWREQTLFPGDDDYVFPDARGGFTRHTNFVKRVWNPIIEAAGANVGFHSFRHFAISTWIEAGLPLKAIQTFAGHSTYNITVNRYGHLFPSDDHSEIMDRIAGR